MKKSLLIASDYTGNELAYAFKRALRFSLNEEYEIECDSYIKQLESLRTNVERYSPPDIIFILNTDPEDYTAGIHFLREYWAELIIYKKKEAKSPPVILLSFDSVQELIRKDIRHIVASSEGVEVITVPPILEDILIKIKKNEGKKIDLEMMKKCLRYSCELSHPQLGHDLINFVSPPCLLVGALRSGDFQSRTNIFLDTMDELERRTTEGKELKIYRASMFADVSWVEGSVEEGPLSEILKDKRILLIDDEQENVGWKITLKAIFGKDIEAVGNKKWQEAKAEDVLREAEVTLSTKNYLLQYDLILLDLYLTKEDKEVSKKYSTTEDLKKYSSYQIVRKIREEMDDPIPIILFTASNKAYNVEIMRKAKVDNYIPKEAHYNEEDAREYYKRFKGCIKELVGEDRKTLREIWRAIKTFDNMDVPIEIIDDVTIHDEEGKAEILGYLTDAYNFLSAYVQPNLSNRYTSISPTIVWLGNLVETLFDQSSHPHVYTPWALVRRIQQLTRNEFHAFIVMQLRGRCAHPGVRATFKDALFTFLTIFQVLNVFNIPIFIKNYKLIKNRDLREKVSTIVGKDSPDKVNNNDLIDLINIEKHALPLTVRIPYLYLFYFWYTSSKASLEPTSSDYQSFRKLASETIWGILRS